MELYEICENLISESKNRLGKYDLYRERNGMDSNIFTVLGMERDEVDTHSNMLYSICKSFSTKSHRDSFIKMLLAKIDLPESFQNDTWEVEREHFTKFGRIDLFFRSKGKNERCIVVEMKIDACDQDRQLKRYEEYAQIHFRDYRILYLTLDGKEPIEQSFKNIDAEKFNCISFKAHILPWLDQCIEEYSGKEFDCSFIRQYEILLKKLVGENHMQNDIKNLIHTSHELLAGMEIDKSVQEVKNEITDNFMKAVKQEFQSKGYEILDENNIEIQENYNNKKSCKYLGYEIKKINSRSKSIYLSIRVEIGIYLYYSIGFMKKLMARWFLLIAMKLVPSIREFIILVKKLYNKH